MEKELDDLKRFLDENRINYRVFEHEPIRTAEQASSVRNVPLHQGVKSLVFNVQKSSHDDLVLVLVSGDKKVDNEKLSKLLNAKNTRLATHEKVFEKTNCEVGSVHPFGDLFGLEVYMDKNILKNEEISFSAGTHTNSISMKTKDFVNLVKPKIEDIAK